MDERAFYKESETKKSATLHCPFCRGSETYDLRWLLRSKVDRLPGHADERDRAKFKKAASYMVLLDDKVMCKNMRCRKQFRDFRHQNHRFRVSGGAISSGTRPAQRRSQN